MRVEVCEKPVNNTNKQSKPEKQETNFSSVLLEAIRKLKESKND